MNEAIVRTSRSGKAAQEDEERMARMVAEGKWEEGQDHVHAAYPFCSVQGLEDTYELNRFNQCSPISGDATLVKAFHLIY